PALAAVVVLSIKCPNKVAVLKGERGDSSNTCKPPFGYIMNCDYNRNCTKPNEICIRSICQQTMVTAKKYKQCAGIGYCGPNDCDGGSSYHCNKYSDYWWQCDPITLALTAETSWTNVSVKVNASYCIEGLFVEMESYVGDGTCVAPSNTTCQDLNNITTCMFGAEV
ncbi:hypothetical protein THRCLA_20742, partial [Thraustotheca clavata]